jgi:hypothetical protein
MKKILITFILVSLFHFSLNAQCSGTATLASSGNWDAGNPGDKATWTLSGATSVNTACLIIIPEGLTLTINSNQTWIGNVEVYGTLILNQQLELGTSSGCGLTLKIFGIGKLKEGAGGGANERLKICGKTIVTSQPQPPDGSIPWPPDGDFDSGDIGFGESGSLPIELLYFSVNIPKGENRSLIQWATSSEENFSHFEIQRAGKDLRFNTILEVQGAGYNTNSLKEYAVYDENPLIGIGYYRLKAVDIDGTYEYFKVKSVNHGGGRRLLVSPNPTTGNSFTYSINWDPGLYDRISLIDAIGNEVYSAPVTSLQNELQINKTLRPGAYLLRYTGSSFQEVTRVFIKD